MQILEGARLLVNEIKAKAGFNSIPVKGATLTYDSDRPLNTLDLVHKQWVEDNFGSVGGFPDFLEEDTYIGNPDNYSFQLGEDGDAINLNVEVPLEFQGVVDTFSGFDYIGATHKSLIGVLKGVNYPQLDFNDADVVGTFMMEGDPFNTDTGSEGVVYMDGIWYDEDDGAVAANRTVITIKEGNIDSLNTFTQYRGEQGFYLQGDSNLEQILNVSGDNSEQTLGYIGDQGAQNTFYKGGLGIQSFIMQGDQNVNKTSILGNFSNIISSMDGSDNVHETSMIGSLNNIIRRENIYDGNSSVIEQITASSYNTELSGEDVMKYDDLQGNGALAGVNITGDGGSLSYNITGYFGSLSYNIVGDDGFIDNSIIGIGGTLKRQNTDPISGDSFVEEIKSNSHVTTLDGDYLYEAQNYNVTANTQRFVSGNNHFVIGALSTSFRSATNTFIHNFYRNGNFFLGQNGSFRAINYESSGQKIGFLGADPIPQQLLPLGSGIDDVITVLHNLGLAKPA